MSDGGSQQWQQKASQVPHPLSEYFKSTSDFDLITGKLDLCRSQSRTFVDWKIVAFPTVEGEYWSTSHKTFLDIGKYRRSMMQVG